MCHYVYRQDDETLKQKDEAVTNATELSSHHDLRVISESEAAKFCCLSLVHFRRLRRNREGPVFVRLTQRRVGYRFHDLAKWIENRLCH